MEKNQSSSTYGVTTVLGWELGVTPELSFPTVETIGSGGPPHIILCWLREGQCNQHVVISLVLQMQSVLVSVVKKGALTLLHVLEFLSMNS